MIGQVPVLAEGQISEMGIVLVLVTDLAREEGQAMTVQLLEDDLVLMGVRASMTGRGMGLSRITDQETAADRSSADIGLQTDIPAQEDDLEITTIGITIITGRTITTGIKIGRPGIVHMAIGRTGV